MLFKFAKHLIEPFYLHSYPFRLSYCVAYDFCPFNALGTTFQGELEIFGYILLPCLFQFSLFVGVCWGLQLLQPHSLSTALMLFMTGKHPGSDIERKLNAGHYYATWSMVVNSVTAMAL